MGNIHSVTKSLESLGEEIILIKNFNDSKLCKAIILPGVGSFDPAMNNLINTDLITDLKTWIKSGKSFFGICLGLQLLFESSDEGKVQGLGILKGKIQKIPYVANQRIPHMGWSQLNCQRPNPLLPARQSAPWMYFVHSYAAVPTERDVLAATTRFGDQDITAMVWNKRLGACQFHPEKSSVDGSVLLKNWLQWLQQGAPCEP